MAGAWPSAGSCHRSIVVLNATEDWERHQLSGGRRRLSEFRVRVWDPMDGLRWTPTNVIVNVLGGNTADVIDTEEDEVVQGVLG